MLNKYKGCLMGALVGDCIGRIFEIPLIPFRLIEVPTITAAIQHHVDKRKSEPWIHCSQ